MKLWKLGLACVFITGTTAPAHAGNIAFSSDRDHAGAHAIYIMKDDGTAQRRLTPDMGDCRTPAFSPNGRKIAFSAMAIRDERYSSYSGFDIFVMNINGSNLQRLTNTNHHHLHPTWSPDGSKIAFSRGTQLLSSYYPSGPGTSDSAIHVMNGDGGDQRFLMQMRFSHYPTLLSMPPMPTMTRCNTALSASQSMAK